MNHMNQVSIIMCLLTFQFYSISQQTPTWHKIIVVVDLERRLLQVSKDSFQLCLTVMLSIDDALHCKQYNIAHTSPRKPHEKTECATGCCTFYSPIISFSCPHKFQSGPLFLFHAKSAFNLKGLQLHVLQAGHVELESS